MKSLWIGLLMLSIISTLFAQEQPSTPPKNNTVNNNCRYERNEVDKFTKKTVRITKEQTLNTKYPNPYVYVKGKNVDGFMGLGLLIQERYPIRYKINKGDELKMVLDNGEVITTECVKEDTGRRSPRGMEFYANYVLSPAAFNALLGHNVTAIRIYHSQGNISIDLATKRQNVIANVLNCVR